MQRKILILIASLAFGFSLLSWSTYTVRESAKQEAFFRDQEKTRSEGGIIFSGPYCFPDKHPHFLLLNSLFLAINLVSAIIFRRPGLSFAPVVLAFSIFPYWYYWTKNAVAINETVPLEQLDRIFYHANEFDVIVCALISAAMVLQGFILLNVLIRRIKGEPRLP